MSSRSASWTSADCADGTGLRPPRRQVARLDREGRRRYVDCEWTLPDGHLIVLEIDGSHHMDARNWGDDLRRERSLVIGGATVLRATTYEVRLEAGRALASFAGGGEFRTLGR